MAERIGEWFPRLFAGQTPCEGVHPFVRLSAQEGHRPAGVGDFTLSQSQEKRLHRGIHACSLARLPANSTRDCG